MSFITHVKKDIVRLKWLLLGYAVLVIMAACLNLSNLRMSDNLMLSVQLPVFSYLISFLASMMSIVIVPLLVHEDSLVGTTAFWLTRPISRQDLLKVKLGFIGIFFLVFPLVMELLVMGVNELPLKYIGLAIPEIILKNMAFIIPVLLLATLTERFSRFAMIGMSIYAGFYVFEWLVWIISSFANLRWILYNFYMASNYSLGLSREIVQDMFIIIGGLAFIFYQYLTSRTVETVKGSVFAFLMLSLVMFFWRIDFMGENVSGKENTALRSISITATLDTEHLSISDNSRISSNDPFMKNILVPLKEDGLLPTQVAVLSELIAPEVVFSNFEILKSSYFNIDNLSALAQTQEKFMASLQSSLPDFKIITHFEKEISFTKILNITAADWNSYKGRRGTYIATAKYNLYEFKKTFVLPLIRWSKETLGSEQVQIFDILETPKGLRVILTRKKANLFFDKDNPRKDTQNYRSEIERLVMDRYVLINKKRGEALLPVINDEYFQMSSVEENMLRKSRTNIKVEVLDFNLIIGQGENQEWLKDAQLIRMEAFKIGNKRALIKQADFVIPNFENSVSK